MQKTSLYIPKPCHEDWNLMTPTQQGKFCSACSKQVIDFSLMSDRQVLNFLSNQSGQLCGRFDAEQLQRPLVETKVKKKKGWWMAVIMPLLFLFDRSEAQEKLTSDTTYNTAASNILVGKLIAEKMSVCGLSDSSTLLTGNLVHNEKIDTTILKNTITVTGNVVDENNYPLAYASVIEKGTTRGVVADNLGNFSIDIKSYNDSATLVVSNVGYETTEKQISIKEKDINFTMRLEPALSGEVVVVGYAISRRTSGLKSSDALIKAFDKADITMRKALKISNFKIFPNPAIKGSTIQLEIKRAGQYQLQLLDNQSRLITVENININSNKSNTEFPVPSNIAAGNYYLRLINEHTKKSLTEKLIIQ